ncbi:MAG: hypothetical protein RIM84_17380 [Alphaproteobacteria bacterium]
MWRLVLLILIVSTAPAAAAPGCAWLVRHAPAADVAYKPGVDVHGRPVVPADLNAQPQILQGQRVQLDLALPVSQFRSGRARRVDDADVLIGELEYDLASGALWLDGRQLIAADQAAVVAYCRDREGLPPLPALKPAPK